MIFLVWAGAGLSQISCAPITHGGATTGSDLQIAEIRQSDETSQLDVKRARIPTSVLNEPTEIDISVHASPSQMNEDQSKSKGHDHDGNEMFRFWFDMYLEFVQWLWSFVQSLASVAETMVIFLVQQVLPLALFLAACTATVLLGFVLVSGLLVCCAVVLPDNQHPTERTRLL